MKNYLIAFLLLAAPLAATSAHASEDLSCKLRFDLSSWSLIYKHVSGHGVVTCNNGQSMKVKLEARGGGLSIGSSQVDDGHGDFTALRSIADVPGTYADLNAHTVLKAGDAQVLTKGPVSLAIAGVGHGVEMGITVGELTISKDE
ncbi:hypothetical protein SAMN04487785_11270 [Dyella jiangningensis]|uniref:hypothetical protein n=1 Tax=Dyella sp. AtDHG13 TaxID=1938897 RepID=UPI0008888614|nr:hypothetical protein [Dyella sp. AtDHG13]PXV54713.1 hypothetical protein BDW41_11294 [Dyella sp. AtDHG13]SDK87721.1 hypothetical protein SAMN04487785_11270 [Dyella jiangningensis]